jgi:hypothetical protein
MAIVSQLVIFGLTVLISMSMMIAYEFLVGYFYYKRRGITVPWYYKRFKEHKYRSVSAFTPHYFFAWIIVGSINFMIMQLLHLLNISWVFDTVLSIMIITTVMISLEFNIGLFYFKMRGKEVPWVYVHFEDHAYRSISGVSIEYVSGWFVLGVIHHFVFEGFFFITSQIL